MKTLHLFLFSLLSFSISNAQLNGIVYVESGCASGGFDYYFFDNNIVISECDGCSLIPYIKYGTYSVADEKVYIQFLKEWYGKGDGELVYVSSIDHYERYVARSFEINNSFNLPAEMFKTGMTDDCTEIISHAESSDPHDWLRNDMVGEYPETYMRKLTNIDLKNKSKKELRLMRNEIYARYGYIFKSQDLKMHFENFDGYRLFSKDVEAFLSEIEKYNVKLIQEYERK